jgi:hypothetical protein
MPSWILKCGNCQNDFVYAKIDDYKFVDFLNPKKPLFPHVGLEIGCPNCGSKAVYRMNQLMYQA